MALTLNKIVTDYNEGYLVLLRQASRGNYQNLLSSFSLLKSQYDFIQFMLDSRTTKPHLLPYPFWFRDNIKLLQTLGFSDAEIQNIFGFLDYIERTQGMTFEECLAKR